MDIVSVDSVDRFIGSEGRPRQVVRLVLRGSSANGAAASASVTGSQVRSEGPVTIDGLLPGQSRTVEIGVAVDQSVEPGTVLPAEALLDDGTRARRPFTFTVAEPGWRMFMVSHFHYDPVWWNTQAAYTEAWGTAHEFRMPFQEPGLALVKAHVEMARRDPDYKFVLAELDYLKPYWAVFPEDRAYVRQLLADGRLELMGGTYNEPNTNLTSPESTIRNAIYGIGYQRDVLGGSPSTAWQLDAFGHDPQFPGIMADAGLTSSSWARGPFHEWGPFWVRGPAFTVPEAHDLEAPRMQFASEFEWISPNGRGLLTSFMAGHYSAGWWLDMAPTLEDAEEAAYRLFENLKPVAATRNVLLPVGTDYTPPNRWLTAIHRDWNRRYVWPKFLPAVPRDFFDAVRESSRRTGRGFAPQTRDMNPIYTGKDVSFIDTKQAQREAENRLLSAEKFATIAGLLGARYPSEAIDKAWRQLLFGAHHDGITGSESDQVYLDLLGGWREATELASAVLDGAIEHIGHQIDLPDAGESIVVFNALSWSRTDVARVEIAHREAGVGGIELRDDQGEPVPFLVEGIDRSPGGSIDRLRIAFIARDVPAVGYRSFTATTADGLPPDASWTPLDGLAIENGSYVVEVDPERGGAIVRLAERASGKDLLRAGDIGNELRVYSEYPNHPSFGEGPWHLTPDGTYRSSADFPAEVRIDQCAIGHRLRVSGPFEDCDRVQDVFLWDGVDRVDCTTSIHGFSAQDRLFRVRFAADVAGGMPVSEVGNAVIGRGPGFPNADIAESRFTLDNPAYNWFALGSTATVVIGEAREDEPQAARAIGVAEVVVPTDLQDDPTVRDLVVGLARAGVTSTLSRHDGSRAGILTLDSNLPDVRICVGGPDTNWFSARVLGESDAGYVAHLDNQLARTGTARAWVPAESPLVDTWRPDADLRTPRALPVLIVAGAGEPELRQAVAELTADLADGVIAVDQAAALNGTTGDAEHYTVAVLNRGLPGFSVETDGSMYLSVMRSCSGWPSGVWIDPPQRTVPDGSNFQFQHWSHTFDYAVVGRPGDWREGQVVRTGHEFNNPLIARAIRAASGPLPAVMSFVQVDPPSVILTAMKPAGNPLATMSDATVDPAGGVVLRIHESTGRGASARIRSWASLGQAAMTNVLEAGEKSIAAAVDGLDLELEPFAITTLRASLTAPDTSAQPPARELAPRAEPAQPVFVDYWMHNKGPAPIGYQPVTVQIRPGRLVGAGPYRLPITVASERTDTPAAGTVELIVPDGWAATPPDRLYRLSPGGHVAFEAKITPSPAATPGRYFVAARITDGEQAWEDVVTIDLRPGADGESADHGADQRSPSLSLAVERALRVAGLRQEPVTDVTEEGHEPEIVAELHEREIRLEAGSDGDLRLRLVNSTLGEIRGEAQLISPHETWPLTEPWSQGFQLSAGAETALAFRVHTPSNFPGGEYWALVKVMYFGRIVYTEAVRLVLGAGQEPLFSARDAAQAALVAD
jgi:alpha-mannosidase